MNGNTADASVERKHRGTLLLMLLEKHSEIYEFDFHGFL